MTQIDDIIFNSKVRINYGVKYLFWKNVRMFIFSTLVEKRRCKNAVHIFPALLTSDLKYDRVILYNVV